MLFGITFLICVTPGVLALYSLSDDFEGDFETNWTLEGAQKSKEQVHGGTQSLKIVSNNYAGTENPGVSWAYQKLPTVYEDCSFSVYIYLESFASNATCTRILALYYIRDDDKYFGATPIRIGLTPDRKLYIGGVGETTKTFTLNSWHQIRVEIKDAWDKNTLQEDTGSFKVYLIVLHL